jgi:hypothetical protein
MANFTRRVEINGLTLTICALILGGGAAMPPCAAAPQGAAKARAQAGAGKMKSQASPGEARQLLERGRFYASGNDFTDRAAEQYRLLIKKYPASREAESAQFYLGTYFYRKFYVFKHTRQQTDLDTLREAGKAYYEYIWKYGNSRSPALLSDAYHSLAMIHLQLGQPGDARRLLEELRGAASKDRQVYLYQVVWSPHSADTVEGDYDAAALAAYTLRLVEANLGFEAVVAKTREWCRAQSGRRRGED